MERDIVESPVNRAYYSATSVRPTVSSITQSSLGPVICCEFLQGHPTRAVAADMYTAPEEEVIHRIRVYRRYSTLRQATSHTKIDCVSDARRLRRRRRLAQCPYVKPNAATHGFAATPWRPIVILGVFESSQHGYLTGCEPLTRHAKSLLLCSYGNAFSKDTSNGD